MNIGIGGVVIPEAKKITMSMRDMVKRYKQIAHVKFSIDRSKPVIKASMILFCHVQSSLSNASPLL